MSTINDYYSPTPPVLPNFTWSPTGGEVTYIANGLVYPPAAPNGFPTLYSGSATPTNTAITFTASGSTTFLQSNVFAILYSWNFGDGTVGYGISATHTFLNAVPGLQVSLQVTDNLGRIWSCAQQISLYPSADITPTVSGAIPRFGHVLHS
jgi:PKD domain-containing protein